MPRKGHTLETAFNSYTISSILGEGGAGQVWSAADLSGNQVAAKILKPSALSREKRSRFKNEIAFCQKISHANVVPVSDHGVTVDSGKSVPFFIMPLYESSYRSVMAATYAVEARLQHFDQMLSGVEAAHLTKVIHRDLKPENFLFDQKTGRVLVADFGIALFKDEELYTLVETTPHARLANFIYAAPEQRTRGASTDSRTDIYALGLMLNELFTGEVPHGQGFKTVAAVHPHLAWVDDVVQRMIQTDPGRRPDSVSAVKELLIAANQEYVVRQKISEITNTVVPVGEEDDPLALHPPKITAVDWKNGRLTIKLDKAVNGIWVQHGLHKMGSWSSVMGCGPEYFNFNKDLATVEVSDYSAQQVIDNFKQWLPRATEAYRQYRAHERQRADAQRRRELADEKRRLETVQRINATLTF